MIQRCIHILRCKSTGLRAWIRLTELAMLFSGRSQARGNEEIWRGQCDSWSNGRRKKCNTFLFDQRSCRPNAQFNCKVRLRILPVGGVTLTLT